MFRSHYSRSRSGALRAPPENGLSKAYRKHTVTPS